MICNMTNGNLSNGTFFKNFKDWFRLKPKLNSKEVKNIFINEGEIWRFMDSKRLFKRIETISKGKFKTILAAFINIYTKS